MHRHGLAVVFLFAAVSWMTGCSLTSSSHSKDSGLVLLSRKPLPGGWFKVKANEEIYRLAQFAMRDVPGDSVKKVHSAKAQEVIGTCYLLSFQMRSGKQWQAELYKDVKGNVTLLEILALKKNKSQKR